MSTNGIKHLAVETIYLVPGSSEGQRCYLWCDDPAPGLDMDPSEAVEYLRKDVHDAIIAKQAKAAKQGMDAAKKVAGSNLEQAKRLSAESSPAALESEREANARLTAELEKVQAERDALAAHLESLTSSWTELGYSMADGNDDAGQLWQALENLFASKSAASLARRDAFKQAEALEEAAADTVPAMHKMKHWLLSRANDLRQQAEGPQ
jgi:predicted nuclease with TOPRIM domain